MRRHRRRHYGHYSYEFVDGLVPNLSDRFSPGLTKLELAAHLPHCLGQSFDLVLVLRRQSFCWEIVDAPDGFLNVLRGVPSPFCFRFKLLA